MSDTPLRTLTSGQVGAVLHLSQATITRYARRGTVPKDTTPGGHFRYNLAEVRAALAGDPEPAAGLDVLLEELRALRKAVVHLEARVEAYVSRQEKP